MSDYHLVGRAPSVEDYNRVRVAAGLSRKNPGAAEVGLANTVSGVCVESGERRIIGDGGLFFEVVDGSESPGMSLTIGYSGGHNS